MSLRRPTARASKRAQTTSAAVVPDPTTTSLASASDTRWNGAGGKSGTINGTGFNASAVVKIDGVAATTTFVNSTQLTFTIPNTVFWTLGAKSITVTNPTGNASNAQTFTIAQPTTYLLAEARASLGRTMNGGTIQGLADQSTNGDANRNYTQLTAAAQPTYVSSDATYNNAATATTDGGDWMQSGTWASPPADPVRHIYVGHQTAAAVAYLFDGLDSTHRHATYRANATQTGVTGGAIVNSSLWDTTTKAIWVAEYNGASSKIGKSTKTLTTISAGTNVLLGDTLFATSAGANKSTGTFAAKLIVKPDVITTAQFGELMDSLASDFGITLS